MIAYKLEQTTKIININILFKNRMKDYKNDTQNFLDYSYGKILDKLVPAFPDTLPVHGLEQELIQGLELLERQGLELPEELPELSEEDEIEIKRWELRPLVRAYVVNMLRTLLNNSFQNYEFSEEELDRLWTGKSEEIAKKHGLNKEQEEITLNVTKQTFLEDLFNETITISGNRGLYTISRTNNGLYVIPSSTNDS